MYERVCVCVAQLFLVVRSPLGAAYLQHTVQEKGVSHWIWVFFATVTTEGCVIVNFCFLISVGRRRQANAM